MKKGLTIFGTFYTATTILFMLLLGSGSWKDIQYEESIAEIIKVYVFRACAFFSLLTSPVIAPIGIINLVHKGRRKDLSIIFLVGFSLSIVLITLVILLLANIDKFAMAWV